MGATGLGETRGGMIRRKSTPAANSDKRDPSCDVIYSYMPVDSPIFSAFVYKVQANMNKSHRDRISFVRIMSGTFERGMTVIHGKSGKRVKLNYPFQLFGQEREIIDIAYPGDVIGLTNPDYLKWVMSLAQAMLALYRNSHDLHRKFSHGYFLKQEHTVNHFEKELNNWVKRALFKYLPIKMAHRVQLLLLSVNYSFKYLPGVWNLSIMKSCV